MPNIALVTTDPEVVNGEDVDLDILLASFKEAGMSAESPIWHDPSVDWGLYDIVIMRSPWDYPERLEEFLDWLDRTAAITTVLNDPALIRWNLDKAYMLELEAAGVRVVPTILCQTLAELVAALAQIAGEVVVKPSISVASRDTGRFDSGDDAAFELGAKILATGKRVIVQPAVEAVAVHGEHALVYFDGVFSHALRKGPILAFGGGYIGGSYTEDISGVEPTSGEVELANVAVAAIGRVTANLVPAGREMPLYARLDIVSLDDGPALLEAELFEPSYFLNTAPGSEHGFVDAVRRRLELKTSGQ